MPGLTLPTYEETKELIRNDLLLQEKIQQIKEITASDLEASLEYYYSLSSERCSRIEVVQGTKEKVRPTFAPEKDQIGDEIILLLMHSHGISGNYIRKMFPNNGDIILDVELFIFNMRRIAHHLGLSQAFEEMNFPLSFAEKYFPWQQTCSHYRVHENKSSILTYQSPIRNGDYLDYDLEGKTHGEQFVLMQQLGFKPEIIML